MKKYMIVVIMALSVNELYGMDVDEFWKGMDVPEFWQKSGIIDSVAVTATSLGLTLNPRESIFTWNVWFSDERQRRNLIPGEKLVFLPDRAAVFNAPNHLRIDFAPVMFRNQRKGLRIVTFGVAGDFASAMFVAFGNTPAIMGEGDVETVMDNGKWVRSEVSRSLEIAKLGAGAQNFITGAKRMMQSPEVMARILENEPSAQLWNTLLERGLIKQNAEDIVEEEQAPYTLVLARAVIDWSRRIDGREFLEASGRFASVSTTSTNLSMRLKSGGGMVIRKHNPLAWDYAPYVARSAREFIESDEPLVLTLDQTTVLTDGRHASMIFEPVSFKNQHKGFRILNVFDARSFGESVTTNTAYIALADTPVQVGEEDVDGDIRIPKRGNGLKFLEGYQVFNPIKVTPVHLSLRLHPYDVVEQGGTRYEWTAREMMNSEDLVLTPNQETKILKWKDKFTFTPIAFKSQTKGFKITVVSDHSDLGYEVTTTIAYLALNDTSVLVGEEDVEMIMENGEWKKYKNPNLTLQ